MNKENLTEIISPLKRAHRYARVCPNTCCWSEAAPWAETPVSEVHITILYLRYKMEMFGDGWPKSHVNIHCEKEETLFRESTSDGFRIQKELKRFSRKSTLSVRYTLLIKSKHTWFLKKPQFQWWSRFTICFICILNRFILLVKLLMLESKNQVGFVART